MGYLRLSQMSSSVVFLLKGLPLLSTNHNFAFDSPLLQVQGFLTFYLHFFVVVQIQQFDRIANQAFFHFEVQSRICCKARCVVDFQNPGLQILIKKNIKTKDFEAHTIVKIVWLAASVGVC